MPVRLQGAAPALGYETKGRPECADRDPGPDTLSVTVRLHSIIDDFVALDASGVLPRWPGRALAPVLNWHDGQGSGLSDHSSCSAGGQLIGSCP